MKFACCLFRYFPFGGVQRNFLRIAQLLLEHGHEVHLYTLRWDGPPPPEGLHVHRIEARGWRNHQRYEHYARAVRERIAGEGFDVVVGFNKMPGLDVYYCGDPCFMQAAHERRSRLYRLTPRYRHFRDFERAVFDANASTQILLLSQVQQSHYQAVYATPGERFHLLPPYVSRDRQNLPERSASRLALLNEFGIPREDRIVLMVGSDYRRKGVARSIRALASLTPELRSRSHLVVVGNGKPLRYRILATRLRVADRVHLLQGRSDVPLFLAAADVLVHPALEENTGTAIVEALVAALPVITTATCGYAMHVQRAEAGRVVDSPFSQDQFDQSLADVLADDALRKQWAGNAREYVKQTDMFSRPQRAVEIIERVAAQRQARMVGQKSSASSAMTG